MEVIVLHAPTPLGLKPPFADHVPGTWRAPQALQRLGLHAALGAEPWGEVRPPDYVAERDPVTGVRNPSGIAAFSADLADAVQPLLDDARFPLVLGGDCSIVLGVALALSRSGRRFGLLYIDAHSDCQTPASSATGGVAGMPLAMVTGNAPCLLTPDHAPRRDITPSDVILMGVRDLFDVLDEGGVKRVMGAGIRVRDLAEIRERGASAVAAEALADLVATGITDVWVHLDVDVLDPRHMPAVDSPDPGGLKEAELTELLAHVLSSQLVKGMHVTIYDPERDPDDEAGRLLVRVLTAAFATNPRTGRM